MQRSRRILRTSEEEYLEGSDDEASGTSTQCDDSKVEIFQKRRSKAAAFLKRNKDSLGNDTITTDDGSHHNPVVSSDNQDEDSLDTFMQSIEEELRKKEESADTSDNRVSSYRGEILNDDDEDNVADFLELLKKKAIADAARGFDDSDDEIELDEDGNPKRKRAEQRLIPPVDHSSITYKPFPNNLYKESAEIAAMSIEARAASREKRKIFVSGYKVPQPIDRFDNLQDCLEKRLLRNISDQGWKEPTAVQAQLIPVMLSGRDTIAVAETGSGKTGAYLISAIQHICKVLDSWTLVQMAPERGPIALVLCPTRELAMQTYEVALALCANLRLRISCFAGGYDKTQQFKEIKAGIELCVGTPGRVTDLATMKGSTNLRFLDTTFLILDEADRMLELGLFSEILSIVNALRPDKQTLLVSATWAPEIERLVTSVIPKSPVKLVVGCEGQVTEAVTQQPIVFPDAARKLEWLQSHLSQIAMDHHQVLIFCKSRQGVVDLTTTLASVEEKVKSGASGAVISALPTRQGRCRYLHGEMSQADRSTVVAAFRNKRFPILVATDIAARGLDVPHITTVINYDPPSNWDTYIHRVGRAARSTQDASSTSAVAYTLLIRGSPTDAWLAGLLAETLRVTHKDVPRSLTQLALTHEPFRAAQLAGRSFLDIVRRTRKERRAAAATTKQLSSAGVGFASKLPSAIGPSFSTQPHFVRGDSKEAQTNPAKVRRRWDTTTQPESFVCGTVESKRCKTEEVEISRTDPSDISSSSTLHVDHISGGLSVTRPKVFSATDDIPSSDDEAEAPRPQPQPSLLRIRNSRDLALKIASRARAAAATAAAATTAAAGPPAVRNLSRSRWD